MSQQYGIPTPGRHVGDARRPPAKYLVLIDSGGAATAKLFLADRSLVSEFDAGSEEVAQMLQGLAPGQGADAPAWDHALSGNSAAERASADIYTLDV